MPRTQVAAVSNYDVGAPAVEAEVLRFRARSGGKVFLLLEATDSDADLTFTAQVSPDGTSTVNTNASDNGEALVSEVVQRNTNRDFALILREGEDVFLHIRASGGGRGQVQIRSTMELDIVTI